ncbi:MAG: glycosyltransferase [Alphaproteobacteria bacterium]
MKHLQRFIAKTVTSFIKNKDSKKRTYELIAEFRFFDFIQVNKFNKTPCRENTVLLVETNGCHGEVVSAHWQYFKELGYNVDILMHGFIYNENHFARQDTSDINIFHCHSTAMHKIFKSKKMEQYKAIVIMTPMNYTFASQSVLEMFPELNKFDNLYTIAHNTRDIDNKYKKFNQNHIFGLGRRLKDFPCTNPHLFGNIQKNSTKHNPTTFITVGGINPKRKNHDILLSATQELVTKGLDFKVIIVGDGKLKNIPDSIKNNIIVTGRQISHNMFTLMESSDFFLTLWDKNNPDHNKYKTDQVSGSPQLIYAFNKIPLVQKEFADFYDFNDKNSIIYEDDNLADAMEQAILMNDKQYLKLYNELDKLSKSVYEESKQNIKKMIK